MYSETSDTELISRVLQGNSQAYSAVVHRHQHFVFTIVSRYIKERELAEEVAQDVFVKAFRSLADFKGTSKFTTWLYTIATTSSITALRKKKLEVQSLDNEAVFAGADAIAGGFTANLLEQKSRVALVNAALRLLSADDANVLTLFYKGEQTLEEIARICGKEVNAVKVQLHRARTRLREKMQTHFKEAVADIY